MACFVIILDSMEVLSITWIISKGLKMQKCLIILRINSRWELLSWLNKNCKQNLLTPYSILYRHVILYIRWHYFIFVNKILNWKLKFNFISKMPSYLTSWAKCTLMLAYQQFLKRIYMLFVLYYNFVIILNVCVIYINMCTYILNTTCVFQYTHT